MLSCSLNKILLSSRHLGDDYKWTYIGENKKHTGVWGEICDTWQQTDNQSLFIENYRGGLLSRCCLASRHRSEGY